MLKVYLYAALIASIISIVMSAIVYILSPPGSPRVIQSIDWVEVAVGVLIWIPIILTLLEPPSENTKELDHPEDIDR